MMSLPKTYVTVNSEQCPQFSICVYSPPFENSVLTGSLTLVSGENLDFHPIPASTPCIRPSRGKAAHPDDLLALEHHWPTRALFSGDMLFGEEPLQFLLRAAVYRPEAIAGTPVAHRQLRAELIGV